MASTLEKVAQERNDKKNSEGRNDKALYLKSDAEFKKIFGLTKDVRVCLTRIPDHLGSGEGLESFSKLMKCDAYKATEFVVKEEERKQPQNLDKKRKAKISKMLVDHTKRKKTESARDTAVNGGSCITSSQLDSSVVTTPDVSHHNILTSRNKCVEEKRTEIEPCTQGEKGTLSSNATFEQSHSFNKNYTEDFFPMTPPELEETIRDEKIRRLKQVLREKEEALEEMRKKMHQK
ncbi:PREDICTED: ligand-dependent nuclear receptor-interacting factor 1 isoform X2 [Condylura cristata]|nr:PREDICTED: ligand-dependent nuclear receptor-interacting factor 1 isoform X2 [Condylura cristata]